MAIPVTVSDENLREIVNSHPVVAIDCYASWCKPCQAFSKIIDELADKHDGNILFGKLDKDLNPASTRRYMIIKVPVTLVFLNGQLVKRFIGAFPKERLDAGLTEISQLSAS